MSASRTGNPRFYRLMRNIRLHERVTGEVNSKACFSVLQQQRNGVYIRVDVAIHMKYESQRGWW